MEIDWGGKFNYSSCGYPMANWQGQETQPTGHKTSEVDWGGHDPNPSHVNEPLLSEVDWRAHNPDGVNSVLFHFRSSTTMVSSSGETSPAQVTTLSKLMVASS